MHLFKRLLSLTRGYERPRARGRLESHPGREPAAAAAVERHAPTHGLLRLRLRGPRPL